MMMLDYKGGKGGQKSKKKWLRNMWTLPLKYAPVSNQIICIKSYVAGFTYKQAITGTFGITLSANFLPMQLLSFPNFKIPETFSLSANRKYFSNTKELLKLLEEVIIHYVKDEREKLKSERSQPVLIILDILSGYRWLLWSLKRTT